MEAEAIITQVIENEGFYTYVPFASTYLLDKRGITSARIILDDGRKITNKQRSTIFALVGFITDWAKAPEDSKRKLAKQETLRELGIMYVYETAEGFNSESLREAITTHYCILVDCMPFSLSDTDMTTAHDFIGWIIDVCVEHAIPIPASLLDYCEDIGRYLYACVAHRRCAICGKKADIHEVETVGMGRNRQKMHHLGQLVQPLCRTHHNEIEEAGQYAFNKKYHLEAIRLDEHLCRAIGWKI